MSRMPHPTPAAGAAGALVPGARRLAARALVAAALTAAPLPHAAAQTRTTPADALRGLPSTQTPAPAPPAEVPAYWRTRAEKSDYRTTADYDETMRYCRLLESGSRWVQLVSYGRSGQGRDLPLLIVSKDRAFTPEQARALGKPIVLVQNGIHAGEIEGKDASLALVRDMAVLRTREELLDQVVLLVLPIFSVDAHERRSVWNRINQNGPDEMGWRFTPIGLNLNRDYLKAETPEMRALLTRVYTRWWPDLLVDDHTTDGADFRHDLTYAFNHGAGTPAALDAWLREAFEGRVVPRTVAMGHLTAPYFDFRRGNDPAAGVQFGASTPRFSTGYTPLHCRPGILVETHMLKPYGQRVRATYDLLVALLEELNARPQELRAAVAAAEAEVVRRGRETDPARREVVLRTRVGERADTLAFKGWRTRWETSPVTGAPVARYSAAPWDTLVPLHREVLPALTVRQPAGYLVPQEWTAAVERLDTHGVAYRRLAAPWRDTVEVQRVVSWSAAARSSEGHRPITVNEVALERRVRDYRAGDVWVPLDQRSALVAVHLFEARAPDGLTHWNAFDTVLEPKEYAEDYIMEPLARRMLESDPALAREFRARLAADSAFAASPAARTDFFYRRSPWADPEHAVLPVARALRAPPEAVLARR